MARIAGINVSDNKHTVIALQGIYGIGATRAKDISKDSNIKPSAKIKELTEAELEILDGATVTTAELNKLDGVTASTTELNLVDGVTASTTELNILDGVTATTAELNIMDGVTSTTAELNILDGVTATTAELNYVDGVTSNVQTQLGTKQPLADDLTTLSGMQTGAAAKAALLTADEIEKIDGLTSSTT